MLCPSYLTTGPLSMRYSKHLQRNYGNNGLQIDPLKESRP